MVYGRVAEEVKCVSKRLNLYFPDNHWVIDIPIKDRAKKVKEILEHAHDFDTIANDIADIKKILLSGNNYIPQPPEVPENIKKANRELIRSILNM